MRTDGPAVAGHPRRRAERIAPARDKGALTAFIARWRDPLCTAAGVASDPRPIRAHVTLGRPPRRAGPEWRPELDRWLREPIPQQPLYLDRIALYTRAAAESGRRFEAVADQSL
jgi:2'-5' RNA ligase